MDNLPEDGNSWGRAKNDYYHTDYVDHDYPTKLNAKEEKLAAIEEEEALRSQKRLLSYLDLKEWQFEQQDEDSHDDLLELIERQNKSLVHSGVHNRGDCGDSDSDEEDNNEMYEDGDEYKNADVEMEPARMRRPINIAIEKNRGLTPYKKKELRNPRVKHKLKYKKAMTKRRRIVQSARHEESRYSGEARGIKTSTIRSIKL